MYSKSENMIENSLNHIDQSYRRILIMYWGAGLNAQQIISLINESDFSTKLENIKIEKARDVLKFLNKSTYYSNIKIVLIDNAEYLNINSSNALLKALEEPNNNTFFFYY